jgi:AraC-like DNA-binding protein
LQSRLPSKASTNHAEAGGLEDPDCKCRSSTSEDPASALRVGSSGARNVRRRALPRVERKVVNLLPQGQARAKVIAEHLGLSDRTLTRRLSRLGTSFDGIVDRLRHQLALKYVTESDLSLTQVAFLLGYANQSAFSLASGVGPEGHRAICASHSAGGATRPRPGNSRRLSR